MKNVKLESEITCFLFFFFFKILPAAVSRDRGQGDRSVEPGLVGRLAVLKESVQVTQTRVIVIGIEKNEKFRLYFDGKANRTCFLLGLG